MLKKITVLLSLLLATAALSAIEPGGKFSIDDLEKKTVPILQRPYEKKADVSIVVFFDALSPDSAVCLQMTDSLPELLSASGKKIRVLALARNQEKIVRSAFSKFRPESLSVYANDKDEKAFRDFTQGEVLVPFAIVLEDGKVRWKGAPAELEGVVKRIFAGTFSFQKQVQIDLFHKDIQNAIQAGVPEVILRTTDKVLAIDPADMISIQARLYVLQGRHRPDLAKAFLQESIRKVPAECAIRLMLLNICIETGDRDGFREAFKTALTDFTATPAECARILAFALENAPFGWIPLKEANAAAATACHQEKDVSVRRQVYQLEILARLAYFSMDVDQAIALQAKAAELADTVNAKAMLDYYKSVKALRPAK